MPSTHPPITPPNAPPTTAFKMALARTGPVRASTVQSSWIRKRVISTTAVIPVNTQFIFFIRFRLVLPNESRVAAVKGTHGKERITVRFVAQ